MTFSLPRSHDFTWWWATDESQHLRVWPWVSPGKLRVGCSLLVKGGKLLQAVSDSSILGSYSQVMGGCSISSNLCAVPDLHSGVSRASKQSCRCTGAPIFAPSWSGDLRVLQCLNRSSFTPWICTNFFLLLRERKTSDTPDAPWGSCCSELSVYIDN